MWFTSAYSLAYAAQASLSMLVHPTGVKQLTLDLRRTLEGWSVVNTDRVNNLVSIQISRQDATRAIDAALDLSY
jgi:hypothetical protein